MRVKRNVYNNWYETLIGRDHQEYLIVDERIILNGF
jgi:hypothetical protein